MIKHVVLLTLGLFIAACSTSAPESPTFPAGRYVDAFGIFEIFNPDGSYEVEFDGEIVTEGGFYVVDGNTVTIIDNTLFCGEDPGEYEWSLAEDGSLQLTLLSDACQERVASMTGSLMLAE